MSQQFPDDPVVFTCGSTCRAMVAAGRRDNHLDVLDSMGLVSSIVLGLSLGLAGNNSYRVVGVEGDGGMLANLNSLATIGYLQPDNYATDNTGQPALRFHWWPAHLHH